MSAADSPDSNPQGLPADSGRSNGPGNDYPRDKRIVKTDEFSSVFHLRPVQRSAHFVLYVRKTELPQARLGVVAAKRFAPRAVTRNTIKRIARELFRQSSLAACDCIIRLSKPVNSKADPATTSSLKTKLRIELQGLLRAYFKMENATDNGTERCP